MHRCKTPRGKHRNVERYVLYIYIFIGTVAILIVQLWVEIKAKKKIVIGM